MDSASSQLPQQATQQAAPAHLPTHGFQGQPHSRPRTTCAQFGAATADNHQSTSQKPAAPTHPWRQGPARSPGRTAPPARLSAPCNHVAGVAGAAPHYNHYGVRRQGTARPQRWAQLPAASAPARCLRGPAHRMRRTRPRRLSVSSSSRSSRQYTLLEEEKVRTAQRINCALTAASRCRPSLAARGWAGRPASQPALGQQMHPPAPQALHVLVLGCRAGGQQAAGAYSGPDWIGKPDHSAGRRASRSPLVHRSILCLA